MPFQMQLPYDEKTVHVRYSQHLYLCALDMARSPERVHVVSLRRALHAPMGYSLWLWFDIPGRFCSLYCGSGPAFFVSSLSHSFSHHFCQSYSAFCSKQSSYGDRQRNNANWRGGPYLQVGCYGVEMGYVVCWHLDLLHHWSLHRK